MLGLPSLVCLLTVVRLSAESKGKSVPIGELVATHAEKSYEHYYKFAKRTFPWMKGDFKLEARLAAEVLNLHAGICNPFCLARDLHSEICEYQGVEKALPLIYGRQIGKNGDKTMCDLTKIEDKDQFFVECHKICDANLFRMPAVVLLEATRKINKQKVEEEGAAEKEEESDEESEEKDDSGFSVGGLDLDYVNKMNPLANLYPAGESFMHHFSGHSVKELPTWAVAVMASGAVALILMGGVILRLRRQLAKATTHSPELLQMEEGRPE